jgi:hypothetical protein
MLESDDHRSGAAPDAERQATASHLSLTIFGVLLFIWGAGLGLASFLYGIVRALSWPLAPVGVAALIFCIVLVMAVPMKVLRATPKAKLWTIVGIGLLGYVVWNERCVIGCICWALDFGLRPMITRTIFRYELDDRTTPGLMIAAIGLTLICSNGWGAWLLQKLWGAGARIASWGRNWSRTHAKLALVTSMLGLWLINPYHAHETCIEASQAAEEHGAYGTAIVFTKLARDAFPEAGRAYYEYDDSRERLTWRIRYLEWKRAGPGIGSKPPGNGNHKRRGSSWSDIGASTR